MQRSKVMQLPEATKAELDRLLVQNGFSDYQGLADWLNEQGFEISKTAVHRYGQRFEERLGLLRVASEQAKAIAEQVGDDDGAMNEAVTALAMEKCFQVLMNLNAEDVEGIRLPSLAKAIADLSKSRVQVQKYRDQVREKVLAVADEVTSTAREKGLSPEVAGDIRAKILGIS
jgi:hypothetical protein